MALRQFSNYASNPAYPLKRIPTLRTLNLVQVIGIVGSQTIHEPERNTEAVAKPIRHFLPNDLEDDVSANGHAHGDRNQCEVFPPQAQDEKVDHTEEHRDDVDVDQDPLALGQCLESRRCSA